MSSKAGHLKEQKSLGQILQSTTDFLSSPELQNLAGHIGQIAGSIVVPIPFIGGTLGKSVAQGAATKLSYQTGLMNETVNALQDGKINAQEAKNIMNYVPNRIKNDVMQSSTYQVITGKKTVPDAIVESLEQSALINWIAPGKTHAWKDNQGNYHKEYVPGSKMVVGEWKSEPNNQPRPDPSSNKIQIGKNGEVIRNGF